MQIPFPIPLTAEAIKTEAAIFAREECVHAEPTLYGVDNGKTIGTYIEQKFRNYLIPRYSSIGGNSAKGIDFPDVNIDVKVTSHDQPQSSCPYKSARQKIFGLGYSLLVFVYKKTDEDLRHTATLYILNTIFIEAASTADYTMTKRLREMLTDGANQEDLVAYLTDRNLPVDEIEANNIASELLRGPLPEQGYLTISNALQWRLQYGRALQVAGKVPGVLDLGAAE